jgi:hypothetical protein
LDLASEPRPFSVELPSDDNSSSIVFMPRATADDLDLMFLVETGMVTVTDVELSSGRLKVAGTFSGTVRSMGGGGTVEITDGRFSVDGVPNLSEITP